MILHTLNPAIAMRVGPVPALLFQAIQFWCTKNLANGKHVHDGLVWTYNTNAAWQAQFPYLTRHQVDGALNKLVEAGLIRKGNFNATPYDRTMWIGVDPEGLSISVPPDHHFRKNGNRNPPDRRPIPVDYPVEYREEDSPPTPQGGGDAADFALTPEPEPASRHSSPKLGATKAEAKKKGDEEAALILAEALPPERREVAAEFVEHRRNLRKPMTALAARKMAKRLGELGGDPVAILEHSIANGYQGVFLPPVGQVPRMNGNRMMPTTADPWARQAVTDTLKEMYRREDEANERARIAR